MWYGMQPMLSLEAKILCILLNVHKLVSLLRIMPTGKSCWWWAFSYCLLTTLTLNEQSWLCTCPSFINTTYCVTASSAYVCVLSVWCGKIMALWVSCHWQTGCISWMLNEVVPWKFFFYYYSLQNRSKDTYCKTVHNRWKQLLLSPRLTSP